MLLTIVSHLITVSGQLYVLVVVEDDLVLAGADGDGLAVLIDRRAAGNSNGAFGHGSIEGLTGNRLGLLDGSSGAVPVVVDSVAQVRTLGVGDRYLHVVGGHGAGDNSLVSGVAVDGGGGDVVGVVEGHTLRMIIGSCAALSVDIVNGQVKDVLLIEHLDDVFTLGYADGQRQVCCLFQRIAVGALIGVRIDLAAEGGLVGLGHQSILHIVDIVLHGVVVLVDRPLGVQVVGAVLVHASGIISGEGSALVVFPTSEGVAGARGQTKCGVIRDRDPGVVDLGVRDIGLVGIEVAVIGDGHSGRPAAPPGVQIHVAGDLDGTVGIVRLTLAVSAGVPAQEDLVAVGEAVVVHRGKDVLGIDHRIVGNGCVGCGVSVIGHRVPAAVADLGVQVVILVDLGAEVEGGAVLLHPTQEGLAFRQRESRHFIAADGAVLGNLGEGLENSAIHTMHCHLVGGSHPLGVQGNVVGGHGLAGEVVSLAGAFLAGVPTGKDIIRLFTGESLGGVIDIRDGLLELLGDSMLIRAIAHKHDVVAVAVIEEFSAII